MCFKIKTKFILFVTILLFVSGFDSRTDIPKFKKTSQDPVLLRYKWKTGEKLRTLTKTLSTVEMKVDKRSTVLTSQTGLGIDMEVMSNDDKHNASINHRIKYVTMKITVLGKPSLTLDTRKKEKTKYKIFHQYKSMIDKVYTCSFTETGVISNLNFNNLLSEFTNRNSKSHKDSLTYTFDLLMKSSFGRLPKRKISPGESYKFGQIRIKNPQLGEIIFTTTYTIDKISADKTFVLIKSEGNITINSPKLKALNAKVTEGSLKGWILFNIKKGNIKKSITTLRMGFNASLEQKNISLKIKSTTKYSSDI